MIPEVYLESSQTFVMEFFDSFFNIFDKKPLTLFAKTFILDV